MRLVNTTTLELEQHPQTGEVSPRYAILSHTWEDEELTFQEFQSNVRNQRRGFQKVRETCRQAREDGFDYAWVDSCCINKESSAELSQTINSMWRWYWNADICYVYLSDLPEDCTALHDMEDDAEEHSSNGDVAFEYLAKCRWFQRGFTLQELLASSEIKFFNTAWKLAGTKRGLTATLSNITGIDWSVVHDRTALRSCTVARRMSRASGRRTRYEEDRAYSLLGIFDVNMPLLYGEGSHAFVRLQEEIIKKSTDQSIFTWKLTKCSPAAPTPHCSPAADDLLFAVSPDQFSHCNNVVFYREFHAGTKFQLSNRGVTFDRLRVCRCEYGTFAVLNCRLDDDLRGPLALRLCMEDELSSKYETYKLLASNDFWIGTYSEDSAWSSGLHPWAVHPHLIVYPAGDFPKTVATECKITLLREHPAVAASLPGRLGIATIYPKVWLRTSENDPSSHLVRILSASPPKFWNLNTSTMIIPARTQLPCSVTTSVTLEMSGLPQHIYMALRISLVEGVNFTVGQTHGAEFSLRLSRLSEMDAKGVLQDTAPAMEADTHSPLWWCKAYAQLEQHLTEVAFVIRFTVVGKRAPPDRSTRGQHFGRVIKNYGGGGYSGGGGPQPRDFTI